MLRQQRHQPLAASQHGVCFVCKDLLHQVAQLGAHVVQQRSLAGQLASVHLCQRKPAK
jgi:hypothetical protein